MWELNVHTGVWLRPPCVGCSTRWWPCQVTTMFTWAPLKSSLQLCLTSCGPKCSCCPPAPHTSYEVTFTKSLAVVRGCFYWFVGLHMHSDWSRNVTISVTFQKSCLILLAGQEMSLTKKCQSSGRSGFMVYLQYHPAVGGRQKEKSASTGV